MPPPNQPNLRLDLKPPLSSPKPESARPGPSPAATPVPRRPAAGGACGASQPRFCKNLPCPPPLPQPPAPAPARRAPTCPARPEHSSSSSGGGTVSGHMTRPQPGVPTPARPSGVSARGPPPGATPPARPGRPCAAASPASPAAGIPPHPRPLACSESLLRAPPPAPPPARLRALLEQGRVGGWGAGKWGSQHQRGDLRTGLGSAPQPPGHSGSGSRRWGRGARHVFGNFTLQGTFPTLQVGGG